MEHENLDKLSAKVKKLKFDDKNTQEIFKSAWYPFGWQLDILITKCE